MGNRKAGGGVPLQHVQNITSKNPFEVTYWRGSTIVEIQSSLLPCVFVALWKDGIATH